MIRADVTVELGPDGLRIIPPPGLFDVVVGVDGSVLLRPLGAVDNIELSFESPGLPVDTGLHSFLGH